MNFRTKLFRLSLDAVLRSRPKRKNTGARPRTQKKKLTGRLGPQDGFFETWTTSRDGVLRVA